MQYRRSKSLGKGRKLNITHRGVGVSQRVGPLSLSTRGNMHFRVGRGVFWRGKAKGPAVVAGLIFAAVYFLIKLTWQLIVVTVAVTAWLAKWAWYGGSAAVDWMVTTGRDVAARRRATDRA